MKSQDITFPYIPDLTLPSMNIDYVDIDRISVLTAMPATVEAVDLKASCDNLNINVEQAQAITAAW